MAEPWLSTFDGLAASLSAEFPCGPSVEYDADYLALEEEVQGKPEVEYGSTLTQAAPADWKRVMQLAMPLATRSRDLRVALHLSRAGLNVEGIEGLTAGLLLIERLLQDHWEHLHPQLEPEDDNDPRLRVNILAGLCEPGGLLLEIRQAALVDVPGGGRLSLRDIDLANGEITPASDQDRPSLTMIDAAFHQAGQDTLDRLHKALEQAFQSSERIESILTERVGFANAIDLGALSSLLRRMADTVHQRIAVPELATVVNAVLSTAGIPPASIGELTSRNDVRHALDRLCAYFCVHEPTSPVPFLLRRARRLLDLDFMELLQDLAPDGVAQMALLSGLRGDEQNTG